MRAAPTLVIAAAIAASACSGRTQSRDHTAPSPAFAAYPSSGPAPLAVRFDGTSSHDDTRVALFQWDFGDGQVGRGAIVDHLYTSRGTYVAALLAVDAAGNGARTRR